MDHVKRREFMGLLASYFYFRPMTFGHLFLRLKLSPLAMEF